MVSVLPILTTILVLSHVAATASGSFGFTNETDRQALLAIRSQITDPLRALRSWNNSIHFCDWNGVKCGRKHQRVVRLNLPSLKLAGNLSPHIGNLTFLKAIELTDNYFHGTIPHEIGRLYRLKNLFLLNNSFQGEIPPNLTQCSRLTKIVLEGNGFQGRLPPELGSLSSLVKLCLGSNKFVGTIPPSIGNLSSLIALSLSFNNLTGTIPAQLGQLSRLTFLELSTNNLSGLVPPELYNLSSLQQLGLAYNRLHGELPDSLGITLPNLKGLNVGRNLFSRHVPTSLSNCSGLVEVYMNGNALTGPVPDNLWSLRYLETLSLDSNQLGGPNYSNGLSFLSSLVNCSNLLRLSLMSNNLHGTIPESIGDLSSSLYLLRLNGNNISGSIPSTIGNLAGMELFLCKKNMLSGHIPKSMGKLSKLQELDLSVNQLSGPIPQFVGNITRLTYLNLGSNLLEGVIPESLGNCSYLEVLDLSDNQLKEEIPRQILGLSSLNVGLFLGGNNLTGPLPSDVSNLINVNALDVSENKLSGTIPSGLQFCRVLEALNMSGNNFECNIPSFLRNMRGIRSLDVSRNNLSGQIPSFLANMALESLNLSSNNFEGEVPRSGVFMNSSAFSVTGNKEVCGGMEELQLPNCPKKASDRRKRRVSLKVIIPVSIVVFIIFLASCFLLVKYRMRKSQEKPSSTSLLEDKCPRLSYATLFHATDGFSSTNLVGKGRYGSVYKGILPENEQLVAVKVFNLQEHGANKTFVAECEALRTIKHRNLVKVITSCSSTDFQRNEFKALVFEFMPKGSLESWLHPSMPRDQQHAGKLNLIQRLEIGIDFASALHYLHTQCDTTIVHCDLKPSNILLDDDFVAHVSDFGLTKILSSARRNSSHGNSSSAVVRGTIGYTAPEYGMGEEISASGDMYSFGVVLMEMFTGKSPTDAEFTGDFELRSFVTEALPERAIEIVDPSVLPGELSIQNLGRERIEECLASVLRIGVVCSAHSPRERMDSKQALVELHKMKEMILAS